jgi:hypothetical protein
MQTFDVYLMIDANGDYAVGVDVDQVAELYDETIAGSECRRLIHITVSANPPVIVEANVTVPDEAGETISASVET